MRLRPQTALLLALLLGVLAVLVERPVNLGALTALAAVYWLSAPQRRSSGLVLLVLALGTWSIVLTQGLFYQGWPRTVALTLVPGRWLPAGDPPGLHLFAQGLLYGLVQSLRLDVMVLLGAGLLGRYASDELTRGLHALRLPPVAGFLFAVAMRHLPHMAAELRTIWVAQRLRGYRPLGGSAQGPGRWARARALLVPLLATTLRKSDEIAAALLSRGFALEAAAGAALSAGERARPWERALVWSVAAGVALLLWAFLMTRLHLAGVWSAPWLNNLYVLVLNHV